MSASMHRPAVAADPGSSALRLGFLGPAGTFTEAALLVHAGSDRRSTVGFPSVSAALDALCRGHVDACMVPFENSVEGSVAGTVDRLVREPELSVIAEVVLPVSFALLVRPGFGIGDVRSVTGHPHAFPQVADWLTAHLPQVREICVSSNAEGARLVAAGQYDAALAGVFAATSYGLVPAAAEIHDVPDARTRFVLVARPAQAPAPSSADKTTLVLRFPGAGLRGLGGALQHFGRHGVEVLRLDSRPARDGLGRYLFVLDCTGHTSFAPLAATLAALRHDGVSVRSLGSYPVALPPRWSADRIPATAG
jgi:prephenate dehydratase